MIVGGRVVRTTLTKALCGMIVMILEALLAGPSDRECLCHITQLTMPGSIKAT